MTRDQAAELVEDLTREWLADAESAVEWAGAHESKWGIRLRQEAREATTIWFSIGDRTVGYEAYLLPKPRYRSEEVYRQCLARNHRSWPASISVDDRGDLIIRGRIPLSDLSRRRLDEAVGAVFELVELSFRSLARAGFVPREKTR